MAMGAADYLVKPVARDALVGALRRVGALPPTPPHGGEPAAVPAREVA